MTTETYIALFGLLAGWTATTLYFLKAFKRAYNRGLAEGLRTRDDQNATHIRCLELDLNGLRHSRERDQDLHEAALLQSRQHYADMCKKMIHLRCPFTHIDHRTLISAADTLRLAQETWQAFPGTDDVRNRAASQQNQLQKTAATVIQLIHRAEQMNERSLPPAPAPVEAQA